MCDMNRDMTHYHWLVTWLTYFVIISHVTRHVTHFPCIFFLFLFLFRCNVCYDRNKSCHISVFVFSIWFSRAERYDKGVAISSSKAVHTFASLLFIFVNIFCPFPLFFPTPPRSYKKVPGIFLGEDVCCYFWIISLFSIVPFRPPLFLLLPPAKLQRSRFPPFAFFSPPRATKNSLQYYRVKMSAYIAFISELFHFVSFWPPFFLFLPTESYKEGVAMFAGEAVWGICFFSEHHFKSFLSPAFFPCSPHRDTTKKAWRCLRVRPCEKSPNLLKRAKCRCVTYEWVMSQVNESCRRWRSHVADEWVMSHMSESCRTWVCHVAQVWDMSHGNSQVCWKGRSAGAWRVNESRRKWISHVVGEWAMSHMSESGQIWASHVAHEWVMWYVTEACHMEIATSTEQGEGQVRDVKGLQHAAIRCNTLQHAATRCNMLQHAATCCNTLQYAATRCNTLQHTRCNTLQHTATRCNTLQHTCCNTLQHAATHTLQHAATRCNTHAATHCNTLQHTATRCNTHTIESCLTGISHFAHEWVVSRTWVSHVTHMNQSCVTHE